MEIIEKEKGLKLEENSEKEIISQKEERENEEKKKSFRTIQELQKLIKKKSEMADYCM